MQKSRNVKSNFKEALWWASIFLCIVVFVSGAMYIFKCYENANETKKLYSYLASYHDSLKEDTTGTTVIVESSVVEKSHLKECAELYKENTDLVGWIFIPGTDISYPVMQTSLENRDYYLKKDFYKNYNNYGSIYASEDCDVFAPSDNVTLYGHNMRDGSMFAQLTDYQEASFWGNHQYISFDTLYEHHIYQVVSAFKISADSSFRYHQFVNASTEAEFEEFVRNVKSREFYDTGIDFNFGDKMLCLSTCEYTLNNGRFVVVAKRIS